MHELGVRSLFAAEINTESDAPTVAEFRILTTQSVFQPARQALRPEAFAASETDAAVAAAALQAVAVGCGLRFVRFLNCGWQEGEGAEGEPGEGEQGERYYIACDSFVSRL